MLKVVGASLIKQRISSYILGVICALAVLALILAEMERIEDDGNYAATVYWSNKSGFKIEFWGQGNDLEDIPRGVARAYYRADITSTGWSQLEIETDASYPDWVQAYSAGLLEGALTWQLIHWHWTNTIEYQFNRAPENCTLLRRTLEESIATVRKKANKLEKRDPFWHQVHLFYSHIDGISVGWKFGVERSRNEHQIEMADFLWMNSVSEIPHIAKSLNISLNPVEIDIPGMASAFVKLMEGVVNEKKMEKLLMAHNSAGTYNSMLRLIKRYKLNYHLTSNPQSPLVPGTSSVFTGYPAAVSSHDEMYIITGDGSKNHKLVITGTTFNNFNDELYKELDIADKVPIGPRVSAANRLATDGRSWAQLLARSNSGSALKQWVVADFTKLSTNTILTNRPKPNTDKIVKIVTSELDAEEKDVNHTVVHTFLRDWEPSHATGLLWVIEQIPGLTHAVDETRSLHSRGYWASYGLPYIQDIAELTDTYAMEEIYGQQFSVEESPRALLFNFGSKEATTFESLLQLMRSNHFNPDIFLKKSNRSAEPNEEIADMFDPSTDIDQSPTNNTNKSAASNLVPKLISKNNTDNTHKNSIESLVSKCTWHGVGVRGDIPGIIHEDSLPLGVIDTKILSGNALSFENFETISGPTYSKQYKALIANLKSESMRLNKGNLAVMALKDEDDGEEDEGNTIEEHKTESPLLALNHCQNSQNQLLETKKILPFKWSSSQFANTPHVGHPDVWDFQPLKPDFVW